MDSLKTVNIYIGTSIRGPSREDGKVCYIMRTLRQDGSTYESLPVMAAYEEATEARLILYAVRDALPRLHYACRVVLHTECDYIAAAITNHWPETWRRNGWKNSRDKDAKDSILWDAILTELEEAGHELIAELGRHEYSDWMRWTLALENPMWNAFTEMRRT